MSWAWDLLVEAKEKSESEQRIREALSGASKDMVDSVHLATTCIAWGARQQDILVVPWGIDLDDFRYSAPTSQRVGHPVRIVSVRSFETVYSVETLVQALAMLPAISDELPGWTVSLAGDGSKRVELEALARSEGVTSRIHWTGRIPERNLAHLLSRSDLYVSTAKSDGTSISLLQAMAVGLPCIVADLPTNREWVQEGTTGWLFEPGNPKSLAATIIRATKERDAWPEMTARARDQVVKRADWSTNKTAIAGLYESALRS